MSCNYYYTTDTGTLSTQYSKLPPPSLNGGLYTGEPFQQNAPWRNFPARPDTGNMIFNNLRSMNVPPEDALFHFPGGGIRPGNNTPELPSAYIATVGGSSTRTHCVPSRVTGISTTPPPQFKGNSYLQF